MNSFLKLILNWKVLLTLLIMVFVIKIGSDTYKEYQWEHYLAGLEDTASPNVEILKDTLQIDYLSEKRTLRIYTPPGYQEDSLRYPVIYFLDGQSLYNEKVQQGDEWQIDEVIDSITAMGGPGAIVVGIDNSNKRLTEYKPFLSEHVPSEKSVSGPAHADWIATDLKSWIDEHYRTLPRPEHATIGGASLGGLMSWYMITHFPEVYGNAIVFSPSLWTGDQVYTWQDKVNDWSAKKVFINAGELEMPTVESGKKLQALLAEKGMTLENLLFDEEEEEGHWHMTWQKGFKKCYPWIIE
ncbi:MAG: hypothetical protein KJP00_08680 [Bacteroidia bacterium]|nr:hypothetical protein [Bacteroidia bacterium]